MDDDFDNLETDEEVMGEEVENMDLEEEVMDNATHCIGRSFSFKSTTANKMVIRGFMK